MSPVSDAHLLEIINNEKYINEQSFIQNQEKFQMMSSRNLLREFYEPSNQKLAKVLKNDKFCGKMYMATIDIHFTK